MPESFHSLLFVTHWLIAKRITDLLIGVSCFLISVPVIVGIAFLVRVESRGNPFFTQIRTGRRGKQFVIFKMRTLYIEHFGIFPLEDEPEDFRITKVGKYLRRSKLDELPQLLNVILGHMSLVGPRPDIPVQAALYTPEQAERLLVKPGLSGVTQISSNTFLRWSDRIRLDIWYIKNWSFLLDIRILCLTLIAVFKGERVNSDPFNLHAK